MLNCKDATELASNALEHKPTITQRISLQLHLFVCNRCRRYVKQLTFIQRACGEAEKRVEDGETTLSAEAKQRIQGHLDKQGQ